MNVPDDSQKLPLRHQPLPCHAASSLHRGFHQILNRGPKLPANKGIRRRASEKGNDAECARPRAQQLASSSGVRIIPEIVCPQPLLRPGQAHSASLRSRRADLIKPLGKVRCLRVRELELAGGNVRRTANRNPIARRGDICGSKCGERRAADVSK